MSRLLLALIAFGTVQQANASHSDPRLALDLRNAAIAGTGCVQGDAKLRLTGSLLQVRTPGLSNSSDQSRPLSRKACAIAIPFKLKSDERLILSDGRLTVDLVLRSDSTVKTSAEVFTDSSNSARAESSDNGPKNRLTSLRLGRVSTACGADGLLRMNLSQILKAESARSEARVSSAIFVVQIVKCN